MKRCPTCNKQFGANDESMRCPDDNTLLVVEGPDLYVGRILAERYELVETIKLGGWSRVYRARHISLNKMLAVKILHAHLSASTEKIKRFKKEAAAAASLTHPNLIAVHDFGVLPEGLPFIVMDFVEGSNLAEEIKKGAMPWKLVVEYFSYICEGLAAAHEKGIIHRDIKPSNIMIPADGSPRGVKIVDFGLAKMLYQEEATDLTSAGSIVGTPTYMSPEQFMGNPVDERCDIYSLGCVMYEMLTGVKPFSGDTTYGYMYKHITEMPQAFSKANPNVQVPAEVEEVVFRCLAKEVDERIGTAEELSAALIGLLPGGDPVEKTSREIPVRSRSQSRRLPGYKETGQPQSPGGFPVVPVVIIVAVVALGGLAVLGVSMSSGGDRNADGVKLESTPAGQNETFANSSDSMGGKTVSIPRGKIFSRAAPVVAQTKPPPPPPARRPLSQAEWKAAQVRSWTGIHIPEVNSDAWLKTSWTDGKLNIRFALLGQRQALDYFMSRYSTYRIILLDAANQPVKDIVVTAPDLELAPAQTNNGVPTYAVEGAVECPLAVYQQAVQWNFQWEG